jgi:hypothetical protein
MGLNLHVIDDSGETAWSEPIGTASFIHAFFSTISHWLEPDGWGTAYAELMLRLYRGKWDFGSPENSLGANDARKVAADLRDIRERLRGYPPGDMIWDIEDPRAPSPWGDDVPPEVTSLADYFPTSEGEDVFEVILQGLAVLHQAGGVMFFE